MKIPVASSRQAQALVALVLGLSTVVLIFIFLFYNRYRESAWLLKHAQDNEESFFAAEGAIEEAVASLRQGANTPGSPSYEFLRVKGDQRLAIDLTHTQNLLSATYAGRFKQVAAQVEILDLKPVQADPVADSADRTGHIRISTQASVGAGSSSVSAVFQIRILDMAIPKPLSHYDIVFNLDESLVGASWQKDGSVELSRLSRSEIITITRDWRYNLLENQQVVEATGIPFAPGRVCRQFSSWQQMTDFLSWEDKGLCFYGDVISADQRALNLANINLLGFGRIYSVRAPVYLDGIITDPDSQLLFTILQKGDVNLNRLFDPDKAKLSFMIPHGLMKISKDSGFKGFAYLRGEHMSESRESFVPDSSLKERRTMVVISGQTILWQRGR
ncbi:MAG: hypothetical protein CVV41_02930 [Candidatus Riflebacteria bacterium HGW-Riflebacteria-1]|jgi:hypothetical protein|nr:MAG: hypothetical protein CVV41_02930 [Candidatus Riflebacteria bacterium HGW-Riflebacteria-1]